MQFQRRGAGKSQVNLSPPWRAQPIFGGIADNCGAEFVGNDQSCVLRQYRGREIGGHRKKQPVAMVQIVMPFLIDTKILDARLDLDNPDITLGPKGDDIGSVPGGKRQFGQGGKIETA